MNTHASDFAAGIGRRCRWARENNGGHPNPAWSTGERLAVALVLGDQSELDREGYSRQEAVERIGGDLAYYGYGGTVETWLADVRDAL